MSTASRVWRVYVLDVPCAEYDPVAGVPHTPDAIPVWTYTRLKYVVRHFAVPEYSLGRLARAVAATLVSPHAERRRRYERWITNPSEWCYRHVTRGRQPINLSAVPHLGLTPATPESVDVTAGGLWVADAYDRVTLADLKAPGWVEDYLLYNKLRSVL